mmetsp:Transcript_41231/g.130007  ORF Transcript_41231/g.130007 Transcript_41231/m.130007 type:complete len:335 (-) Transcript_41231:105-1109(-)
MFTPLVFATSQHASVPNHTRRTRGAVEEPLPARALGRVDISLQRGRWRGAALHRRRGRWSEPPGAAESERRNLAGLPAGARQARPRRPPRQRERGHRLPVRPLVDARVRVGEAEQPLRADEPRLQAAALHHVAHPDLARHARWRAVDLQRDGAAPEEVAAADLEAERVLLRQPHRLAVHRPKADEARQFLQANGVPFEALGERRGVDALAHQQRAAKRQREAKARDASTAVVRERVLGRQVVADTGGCARGGDGGHPVGRLDALLERQFVVDSEINVVGGPLPGRTAAKGPGVVAEKVGGRQFEPLCREAGAQLVVLHSVDERVGCGGLRWSEA